MKISVYLPIFLNQFTTGYGYPFAAHSSDIGAPNNTAESNGSDAQVGATVKKNDNLFIIIRLQDR